MKQKKRILKSLSLVSLLCLLLPIKSTGQDTIDPTILYSQFLGQATVDVVGQFEGIANGRLDWHIVIKNLPDLIAKLTINEETEGKWEMPPNGTNWVIARAYGPDNKQVDLLFEPYGPGQRFNLDIVFNNGNAVHLNVFQAVTLQENLQYEVIRSYLPDIDTVANAERNGLVVQPFTKDITYFEDKTLRDGTTYYFTVVVKDDKGNKSLYKVHQIIKPPVEPPKLSIPPTVQITSPAANTVVSGKIKFESKAMDDVGITKHSIYVNGNEIGTACACDTRSSSYNTAPYKGKVIILAATAEDADGNKTTKSITISVKR